MPGPVEMANEADLREIWPRLEQAMATEFNQRATVARVFHQPASDPKLVAVDLGGWIVIDGVEARRVRSVQRLQVSITTAEGGSHLSNVLSTPDELVARVAVAAEVLAGKLNTCLLGASLTTTTVSAKAVQSSAAVKPAEFFASPEFRSDGPWILLAGTSLKTGDRVVACGALGSKERILDIAEYGSLVVSVDESRQPRLQFRQPPSLELTGRNPVTLQLSTSFVATANPRAIVRCLLVT